MSKFTYVVRILQTVSNINKWNQVQEELTQDAGVPMASSALVTPFSRLCCSSNQIALVLTFCVLYVQATSQSTAGPSTAKPEPSTTLEVEFEFSDVTGLMCLLCARQFKTIDQLKRHNKESDLHKARNLQCCVLSLFPGLTLPFVLPYPIRTFVASL